MWNRIDGANLNVVSVEPVMERPLGVLEFFRERLKFFPDEAQQEVIAALGENIILNCTRQWGKTSLIAGMLYYEALSKPETLYLIVSPAVRQDAEMLRKEEKWMGQDGIPVRGDGIHEHSLQFPNGSRIVAIPSVQATARGYSAVSVLVMEEASQVPELAYDTLRPTLAVSGGRTWLLSTPFGKRGFFWKEWAHGGDEWERFEVKAEDCPRIPKKFLEGELRRHGRGWMNQEYGCVFAAPIGVLFSEELLEGAIVTDGKESPL